jgi:hypothetical protein
VVGLQEAGCPETMRSGSEAKACLVVGDDMFRSCCSTSVFTIYRPRKRGLRIVSVVVYVRTSKTQRVSMTTINWLMLFKEIIAVYSENYTKLINTISGQNEELLNVKVRWYMLLPLGFKGLNERVCQISN